MSSPIQVTRGMTVALSIAATLAFATPAGAQRHGRADSVQAYAHSSLAPALEIQWTSSRDLDRWRAGDLEMMDAHTVVAPFSKHMAHEAFSGVRLGDLFAKRGAHDLVLLEVHYGFFQKKTLHWQELDHDQTIVVTQRDGSRLQDGAWLVAVDTHGRSVTMKAVTKVVVSTPSR